MSRVRTLALWGSGFAVLGAALFGGYALSHRQNEHHAKAAWTRFSRCLVGDTPLGDEKPSARVRRESLGVEERRAGDRAEPNDEGWPKRCADEAQRLRTAWLALHEAKEATWMAQVVDGPLQSLAAGLAHGDPPDDILGSGVQLDALWTAANELEALPADGDAKNPAESAPKPANVLSTKTLTPLLKQSMGPRFSSYRGASIRLRDSYEGSLCRLDATGDLATTLLKAHCMSPSGKIPRGSTQSLTTGEDGSALMLSVFDYEVGGVFSAETGARLLATGEPTNLGAFAKADGWIFGLDRRVVSKGGKTSFAGAFDLVIRGPHGEDVRVPVDAPNPSKADFSEAQVVGENLVWTEGASGKDHKLRARALLTAAPWLGPVEEIGVVPEGLQITASTPVCSTREALSLALMDPQGPGALVVRKGGAWSAPVTVEPLGTFACSGDEVTFTSASPKGVDRYALYQKAPLEVRQTRCKQGQCQTVNATLPGLVTTREATESAKVVVVDVGGSVALVRLEDAVTLRFGKLDELAKAPVRTLFDASFKKSGGTLIQGIYATARGEAAVLFLSDEQGAHAVRIDARGEVRPINVE